MLAFRVPAPLKHIEEARDIGIDIGVWIDQGMAHAGLRGEMHGGGEPMRSKQIGDRLSVRDVDPRKCELRERLELLDAGLLQVRIVISIEVVDTHHIMPVRYQAARDMHADEPGCPGDKNRLPQASSLQRTRLWPRPANRHRAVCARLMALGAVSNRKCQGPANNGRCAPQRDDLGLSLIEAAHMSDLAAEAAALNRWLFDVALPLWWQQGADRVRGGFHEAISLDGRPLPLPHRARVIARQAFSYCEAGRLGWRGPWREAQRHALDYFRQHFIAADATVVSVVDLDGKVGDAA